MDRRTVSTILFYGLSVEPPGHARLELEFLQTGEDDLAMWPVPVALVAGHRNGILQASILQGLGHLRAYRFGLATGPV